MNIVNFVKPKVRENKWYKGEIVDYSLDLEKNTLRIYVIVDKEPTIRFMRKMDVRLEVNSHFYKLCYELDLFNDDLSADLDLLIETRVLVTFHQVDNGQFFIDKIKLDAEFYEQEEQDEE